MATLDAQAINELGQKVLSGLFGSIPALTASQQPDIETLPIENVDGRMRISGIGLFETASYIGIVSFYKTQAEAQQHKNSQGTAVVYVDSEQLSKFLKGLEIPFAEDEDDETMLKATTQLAEKIGVEIKQYLSSQGFGDFIADKPIAARNSLIRGAELASGLKTKQRLGSYFLRRKTFILDLAFPPLNAR